MFRCILFFFTIVCLASISYALTSLPPSAFYAALSSSIFWEEYCIWELVSDVGVTLEDPCLLFWHGMAG